MKIKPFELERYFAKHEFSAPYLLCCSDCESITVKELLSYEEGSSQAFESLSLGYTESLGNPELRIRISLLYDNISPEEIIVHSCAEEAIFNFMNVALDPGDNIIVHTPYYQSLGEVAKSIGAEVTEWKADSRNNWELDLGELKDKLKNNTKVVVVNFPHNPTGYLPSLKFINELSRLSRERGFIIFSDEVYRGLEYDSSQRLPAFTDLNENAVSLGVMSKTYGLAGLRIGWIATHNKKVFSELACMKDYTTICNSAPGEFLATVALKHQDKIIGRNLNIIKQNLVQANSFFSKYTDLFEWNQPKAGPIAFPHYKGKSMEKFCELLVRKTGVLLLPGTVYGEEYNNFRLGFGRQNFSVGLTRLEDFISRMNNNKFDI